MMYTSCLQSDIVDEPSPIEKKISSPKIRTKELAKSQKVLRISEKESKREKTDNKSTSPVKDDVPKRRKLAESHNINLSTSSPNFKIPVKKKKN